MPAVCAVFGCNRTIGRNALEDDGVTPLNFFRFPPTTSKTFKSWVASCRRKDLKKADYGSRVVCSRHFDHKLIHGNRITRPRLDPGAVPISNLHNQSSSATLFKDISQIVTGASVRKKDLVHMETVDHGNGNNAVTETEPISLKSLHPIHDINFHNRLWTVKLSGDVVWYIHFDVEDNTIPEIFHSVKVSMRENKVKFYVGAVEIENQSRIKIVGHFNLIILEDFLAVLETFQGFYPRKQIVNHLLNVINGISIMLQRNMEGEPESTFVEDDEGACEDSCLLLFVKEQLKMYTSELHGRKWNPAVLRFALIVHFHSPAAYRSIYQSGYLLLPSERTLNRYIVSVQAQPGLPEEHLSRLTTALNELKSKDKHLQLLIDEIQIRPEVSFDGQVIHGLATNVEQDNAVATKIVAFMLQSICGSFRDIAAFFPVKNMNSEDLRKWTLEVITSVEACGGKIEGITMDNAKTNQRLAQLFGVKLHPVVQSSVCHPVDHERTLTFLFDPCHLVKCIRNNWINASGQKLLTVEGNVCFMFLKRMYELELNSQHKLAKNLSAAAISPSPTQKQSVRLAVNVISPSTCCALKYFKETNSNFQQVDATILFLKTIYQAWCWMNISYPGQDGREKNENLRPFSDTNDPRLQKMEDMQNWLRQWNGKVKEHSLTTDTFHALLVTLQGIQDIIRKLLREPHINYILTAKLQQDALEERFGAHRLRAGSAYNPSVLQFCQTETKLRTITYQATSVSTNTYRGSSDMQKKRMKWNETPLKIKSDKRLQKAKDSIAELEQEQYLRTDHDYAGVDCPNSILQSFMTSQLCTTSCDEISVPDDEQGALIYIAGYIAFRIAKKDHNTICNSCKESLYTTSDDSAVRSFFKNESFIYFDELNRDGLSVPSLALLLFTCQLYRVFKLAKVNKQLLKTENQLATLMVIAEYKTNDLQFKDLCHRKKIMAFSERIYFRICLKAYCEEIKNTIKKRTPTDTRKMQIIHSNRI